MSLARELWGTSSLNHTGLIWCCPTWCLCGPWAPAWGTRHSCSDTHGAQGGRSGPFLLKGEPASMLRSTLLRGPHMEVVLHLVCGVCTGGGCVPGWQLSTPASLPQSGPWPLSPMSLVTPGRASPLCLERSRSRVEIQPHFPTHGCPGGSQGHWVVIASRHSSATLVLING